MAVAGGTVAVAALTLPAALSGDPDHSQRKQHSQYYQRDDPAKCHIHPSISFVRLSAPSIHDLQAKSNSLPHIFCAGRSRCGCPAVMLHARSPAGRFCWEGKCFEKSKIILNWGLHFGKCRAIIITFQFGAHNTSEYGGLAQLVRAPASHAGGLGFESLILHHTVRTRTRFFTKKGFGYFFIS